MIFFMIIYYKNIIYLIYIYFVPEAHAKIRKDYGQQDEESAKLLNTLVSNLIFSKYFIFKQ